MKNYLLTGGTGFIGKHVLKNIAKSGDSLSVVVRKDSLSKLEDFSNIKDVFVTENLFLESKDWWRDISKDIDVIIHAAWYMRHKTFLNSSLNLECLNGSLNLALGAIEARVKKFVGIGSCFEYAPSSKPLTIQSPLGPFTLYGATKTALYLTLSELFKTNSISFAWARLFYTYGRGEDPAKLTTMVRNKIKNDEPIEILNGSHVRDFLNVSDVGEMIYNLSGSNQNGVVNICSGVPITIKDYTSNIALEKDKLHLLNFLEENSTLYNPSYIVGIPNLEF